MYTIHKTNQALKRKSVRPHYLAKKLYLQCLMPSQMLKCDYYYAPRKLLGGHIVAALSVCPSVPFVSTQNFVIWSRISKLFHRNDHHVETSCHAQHLGPYLEGQGHSVTLQQNRVRPIISLFKVGFWNYFTEMTTMLRRHVVRNI